MKVEISVPEVVSIFKEIQEQPEKIWIEGDGHKYINNSVMIRQSGSCGVRIQKEPGNIPLPISA